jgi:hypothetical protein
MLDVYVRVTDRSMKHLLQLDISKWLLFFYIASLLFSLSVKISLRLGSWKIEVLIQKVVRDLR